MKTKNKTIYLKRARKEKELRRKIMMSLPIGLFSIEGIRNIYK